MTRSRLAMVNGGHEGNNVKCLKSGEITILLVTNIPYYPQFIFTNLQIILSPCFGAIFLFPVVLGQKRIFEICMRSNKFIKFYNSHLNHELGGSSCSKSDPGICQIEEKNTGTFQRKFLWCIIIYYHYSEMHGKNFLSKVPVNSYLKF